MPIYTYQCEDCDYTHDETLTIDTRDALVGCPCPECGIGKMARPFILNVPRGEPRIDTAHDIETGKHPQVFLDNIRRTAESKGVKGTKYADTLKSRFGI